MVVKRYNTVTIATGAGETLTDGLAGLGEKKRTILSLIPQVDASNSTARNVSNVRVYKNQDQIVDYNYGSFQKGVHSGIGMVYEDKDILNLIELDLPLERGDSFQVGFYGATSTGGGEITICYTDLD